MANEQTESVVSETTELKSGFSNDIKKHAGSKYIRSATVEFDVYQVLDAYKITNPGIQHALKKLLCAGLRNKGSMVQDLKEAVDALVSALRVELHNEILFSKREPLNNLIIIFSCNSEEIGTGIVLEFEQLMKAFSITDNDLSSIIHQLLYTSFKSLPSEVISSIAAAIDRLRTFIKSTEKKENENVV